MKVKADPAFPTEGGALQRDLRFHWANMADQLNGLSEGRMVASYGALTAAPTGTAGPFQVGDFIRNSAPAELGTTPNKYVIYGWICTVAGSPGTWLQQRFLTGN